MSRTDFCRPTTGTDASISAVGRINPADGSFTFYRLTTFGRPTGIAVGADNNIWVAEPGNQKVARIVPTTGAISEFAIGTNATELTKGSDGNIWFAGDNQNQIGKLSNIVLLSATVTIYSLPASSTTYTIVDVVLGLDGNVWYTGSRTDSSGSTTPVLGNFDTNGAVQDFALPPAPDPCCPRTPGGIYSDSIGQIWYTDAYQHLVGHTDSVRTIGAPEFSGGRNPSEPLSTCVVCASPINPAFGDMWHSFSDLAVPGRGSALALTRTYDSLSTSQNGARGFGWTHSYMMTLRLDGAGNATIIQENGSQVRFAINGSTFSAPPRVLASLTRNSDGSLTLKRKDLGTFTFNAAGQLVAEGDRNGYGTTLAYTSGQLSTVTDPAGRSLSFTYSPDGHLASVIDPAGRGVSYQYSSAGDLVAVTDVVGATSKFAYDAAHHLTVMTEANGGTTTTSYDGFGRAVAQTDPLNRAWGFQYGSGLTTVTSPNGRTDVMTFANGILVSATRGVGTSLAETIKYERDPATGGVTKLTDGAGHVMTASYDATGNLLNATDALGRTVSFTFSALGDILSTTDALGITSTFSRDAIGNLLSVSRPEGGSGSPIETISYVYGDPGHPGDVTALVDQLGKRWTAAYDGAGDLVSESNPLGDVVAMTYDTIGRLKSAVTAGGHTYARTFNAFDQTLSVTDPLGSVTFQYDAVGNLVATKDPNGGVTNYAYDADREPVMVTRPDGSAQRNTYDAEGNTTAQSDGLGNITRYNYDLLDRVVSSTDALGRTATSAFDLADNVTSVTDAAGRTTSFTYDSANELVRITYSDGRTSAVSYTYDARGRRISMTDGTGTSTYAYDSLSRLLASTDGFGQQTQYHYDLSGRLASLTYPSGAVVTRGYDDIGRLTSVTDWAGHTSGFSYNADGNLVSETLGNGIRGTVTTDVARNLTGIRYDPPSGQSGGPLLGWSYQNDTSGQLTAVQPASSASGPNQRYTYDSANRLTAEATFINLTYTYDAGDNLIQLTGAGEDPFGTATFTYDAAHQLVQTVIKHDQRTIASFGYSYDANGNRTQVTTGRATLASYAYDQANRLVGLTAGRTTATYGYNGDGLRVSKTVGGRTQRFAWDISQGMPLVLGDGQAQYVYGVGGQPLEQVGVDGRTHYFLADHQGSTRALAAQNGQLESTFQYNAYGQLIAVEGRQSSPLLFAGQYLDAESNLYYMRARMYDPLTGQFTSNDPAGALTRQPYAYAGDNPVNRTDPGGLATDAFCIEGQGIVAPKAYRGVGVNGGLTFCLVRADSGAIGVTASFGAGPALAFGHSASATFAEEVTNANTLQELGGFFTYGGIGVGIPIEEFPVGIGASIGGFYGCTSKGKLITGGVFGVGVSIPGVAVVGGRSNTFYIDTFSGLGATAAASLFNQMKQNAGALFVGALLAKFITDYIVTHYK